MKKSNPSVYPITAGFEEQLKLMGLMCEHEGELWWELPLSPDQEVPKNFNQVQDAAKVMLETLGEYEHGTAEPFDLIAQGWETWILTDLYRRPSTDLEEFSNQRRKKALITLRNVYTDLLLTMGSK
jgi:hypothetical protein